MSFVLNLGKKIDSNFSLTLLFVVVTQLLLLIFSLPFHWLSYIVSGYIFWRNPLELFPKISLYFAIVPIVYCFYDLNPSGVIFAASIILQALLIFLLRKLGSWSLVVEFLTIILLATLALMDIFYPEFEQVFISYIAGVQELNPQDVMFAPGALLVGLGSEVLIFAWLSSRWCNLVGCDHGLVLDSAANVRVSLTMLIVTIILPIFLYVIQHGIISYGYILSLPYSVAGISFFSWAYKSYKSNRKDSDKSVILLIFILLCATFVPLSLGLFGLLDIGLNLRKKYYSYLKRR